MVLSRPEQAGDLSVPRGGDGATRVNVTVTGKGDAKSQAAVEHERLPDARAAAEAKAYRQERLTALKALLEGEVGEAPPARSDR